MCRRCKCLSIFGSVTAVVLLLNTTLNAGIIVNDSFADGDLTKTGALDTNWWTSSSSSGIEVSAGSLGLVTGSSGRGIHTVFPTQTLSNLGDSVKATYTFTAPATVGTGSGSFRVGLFDTLGRAGLDGDVSASSGSPNALFGWSVVNGGPGDPGLPGYLMDMDVNDGTDDLNIRKHITNSATGRLMSTTGNGSFSSLGNGDNNVYSFAANTEYTGSMSMTRISATEVEIAGTLGAASFSITDTFDSIDVGMLAFHVNSNQFGSSSTAGDPNNGIDFSNVTIEFSSVPEPSTLICAIGSLIFYPGFGRRRRSH